MNFFRQLTEKPWLPDENGVVGIHDAHISDTPAARVGLKMFLIIVGFLFFLLTVAYAGRMAFEDWRPVPQPWLMWQNSFMLIMASVSLQMAQTSARRDQWNNVKIALLAGGAFTVAFIVGQLLAWRQLVDQGIFEFTNPAVALFILITGMHGLHMLGGLVAWGRTADKVWQLDKFETIKVRQSIENCTLYWHFLLAIWLVLFGLLFSGNDNLGILLTICGIK
jgi:cytochrome c oxidase subunit 3